MAHHCSGYAWALLALTLSLLLSNAACSTEHDTPGPSSQPHVPLSSSSARTKDALHLIPWTADILFVLDVRELRSQREHQAPIITHFDNFLRTAIDQRFNTDEIAAEEVDLFVYAASHSGYDNGAVLLQGDFHLENVRLKLQNEEYDQRTYRSQELWAGGDTYAILEDRLAVIASSHEPLVKEFIKVQDSTITSLHRLRHTPYAQLLGILRDAPMFFASGFNPDCDHRLLGCRPFGIRYDGTGPDQSTVHLTLALVLADQASAAAAADQHLDASDAMARLLHDHTSWGMSTLQLSLAQPVQVENLRSEDNILLAEAAIAVGRLP